MPRGDLDRVLAHAEEQLGAAGKQRPTEVLPVYKKFLKIEEHRLRLKHQAGGGGREICQRRVHLVDVILRHVFNAASGTIASPIQNLPLALIALGGYGRGELNPFSDVDVMLLHGGNGGKVSRFVEAMAEQILYLLWDIGFKVGHSTRSVRDAIDQANRDMLTKTAMLESRFLAGDNELTQKFRKQFRLKCVVGHERAFAEMRMQDQATRHAKFGGSVYMQEPHVKNGCGGLRDYQNLLWMSYFKEGVLTTSHLVAGDWLSESDRKRIEQAYDFLLRLRSDLHYATGRASDVLHFNIQERIATRLNYPHKNGQQRSETLMRDYYEHTRNIFRVTEQVTQQFATGFATKRTRSLFSFLPLRRTSERKVENFCIRGGQLFAARFGLFKEDSLQMMRAFQIAQEQDVDLSAELADSISRNLGLITRTYCYAKTPREIFRSILSQKGNVGRVLRMMHQVNFLGRYIPEFGQMTCLVQHEFFHRYTADEHTLLCIDKLDALTTTESPKLRGYRRLFEEFDEPMILYLALLLHDTGRAVGARPHSEASAVFAQRVANRLQLSSEQRKSLILLVDHHITLSTMAQQRNIDDPATVIEFAHIIKSQRNLDALLLLTLADGQGTSGQNWSDWKESLVWQLYDVTTRYLADQKSYLEQIKIERDELQKAVAARLSPDYADDVEAHFDLMPDSYFRASELPDIVRDLKVVRTFFVNATSDGDQTLNPALHWQASPDQGHSIVSICSWDRQQLLAKIAGSFSIVPLNILSADVFTREDNTVLDIFRVCDTTGGAVTDQKQMQQVEETLRLALKETNFNFGPLLEKTRNAARTRATLELEFPTLIAADNKAHPHYTLLQVQTPDRLGLLYDLLSCLGAEGVSIVLSRISTQNGAAIDTFYVTDGVSRGKITDPPRIAALQKRLHAVATSGPAMAEHVN